jgi:hypothetical protein
MSTLHTPQKPSKTFHIFSDFLPHKTNKTFSSFSLFFSSFLVNGVFPDENYNRNEDDTSYSHHLIFMAWKKNFPNFSSLLLFYPTTLFV